MGGNLGDSERAFARVRQAFGQGLLACSALYRTEPQGPPQPRYWNQALLVQTTLSVLEVLDRCQALEREAGRNRRQEQRWGPRALDVDLLMAERLVYRGPRLELPHPRLAERAFALVPAAEIAPHWVHPTAGRTLAELARAVAASDPTMERVG